LGCAAGTAKQLWGNQEEEVGLRAGRGLQNFAEAGVKANEVGQKAGSPCFCLIVLMRPCVQKHFCCQGVWLLFALKVTASAANERTDID